jgi:nucleotide-binding universal stress UspA family protein
VGIDGSPASVAAVRWAGREAQLRGMRIHVVYVRDRRLPIPHYAPQPRASEPVPSPAAGERMQAVVREALGTQPPAGVQMELADGLPARVLIDRSVGAEMLVLGSASPSGASPSGARPSGASPSGARPGGTAASGPVMPPAQARAPLGPVARDCLHAAPCPVVVVRSGDTAAPAGDPAQAARTQPVPPEAVRV